MNVAQTISLVTSALFLITSLYLVIVSKPQARWIYVQLSFGWIGGIVFYMLPLFENYGGHDFSPVLGIYQNICFGIWILITACERICSGNIHCKNLKTRMKTWKTE